MTKASWGATPSDEISQVPLPEDWTYAAPRSYRFQCAVVPLLLEGLRELWILLIEVFSPVRLHASTDVSTAFILAPSTDFRSISLCDTQMFFPRMLMARRSKPTISVG